MSNTPNSYECLARDVYAAILRADGIENITVQHDLRLRGRSGVEHQVDVSWRFRQAGVEHAVLIECKYYARQVELGDVRSFFGVLYDVGASRGIIVTTQGFQKGAAAFGSFYGIALKVLRKPTENDWQGRIRHIEIELTAKFLDLNEHPPRFGFEIQACDDEQRQRLAALPTDLVRQACDQQLRNEKGVLADHELASFFWQILPVEDKETGGPYRHTLPVNHLFTRLVLPDREEIVRVNKLHVEYYVAEEIVEPVSLSGDEIVQAMLKDFQTGAVEHIKRDTKSVP